MRGGSLACCTGSHTHVNALRAGANWYDYRAYRSYPTFGNVIDYKIGFIKKVWSGEVVFNNNESFFVNLMGNHIELNLS